MYVDRRVKGSNAELGQFQKTAWIRLLPNPGLRVGDSEAVKMLTEVQARKAFPQELKATAQKALAALPK